MKPQEIFVLLVIGAGFLMTLAFRYGEQMPYGVEIGGAGKGSESVVQSSQDSIRENSMPVSPSNAKPKAEMGNKET